MTLSKRWCIKLIFGFLSISCLTIKSVLADISVAEPNMQPETSSTPQTQAESASKNTVDLSAPEITPSLDTPTTISTTMTDGSVARAVFTSQIIEREPADELKILSSNAGQVFFFTELTNLTGRTIIHRWEYNGEIMSEIKFNVGGPRWRVYSSKNILPKWTGSWTVHVATEEGAELQQIQLTVASSE